MAHHLRIRKDPGWALGSLWTSAEQAALDAGLIASVNGDGGGTWSPSGNVNIQGAGVRLIGTTHTISGAHSFVSTNGTSELLTHGDSDYCVLGPGHTGASLSIRSPLTDGRYPAGWTNYGPQSPFAIVSTVVGATVRIPLRVHNGAVFAGAKFTFAVTPGATQIPAQTPRFGVFARDAFGNKTTLLEYYQPTPQTVADWVSGGFPQPYQVMLSHPSVAIDTSKYSYFAEIVEASGANAIAGALGVVYLDLVGYFIDVLDIRPR